LWLDNHTRPEHHAHTQHQPRIAALACSTSQFSLETRVGISKDCLCFRHSVGGNASASMAVRERLSKSLIPDRIHKRSPINIFPIFSYMPLTILLSRRLHKDQLHLTFLNSVPSTLDEALAVSPHPLSHANQSLVVRIGGYHTPQSLMQIRAGSILEELELACAYSPPQLVDLKRRPAVAVVLNGRKYCTDPPLMKWTRILRSFHCYTVVSVRFMR
jgi:hypothetical protein